eukprot:438581_1
MSQLCKDMEQLDIDALKKYAGVYETELIFHLTLINKSLFDIHCLSHCVHLVTLDISESVKYMICAICHSWNISIWRIITFHHLSKSLDKAFSNPICDDSAYTKKIMEICARREDKHQIVSIDHCRIASIEVRQSIDQMLAEYRRESKQKLNSEGERETISSWIQSCDVLDGKFNPLNTVIRNDLKFQTEKKKLLAIIQSSKNELSKLNIAFKNCTERK